MTQIFLQQVALGGMLIALPIYLQLVWGYNALEAGVTLAPLSLTMFGVALLAGQRAGGGGRAASSGRASSCSPRRSPSSSPWCPGPTPAGTWRSRSCSRAPGSASSPPSSTTTRSPRISEERVGEAAGVTSATGSFGLSFGLAFAGAIMLATLSIAFTNMAESSSVLPPADQQRVATVLEDDAQVMSDAQLEELLAGQPEDIQDEILASTRRPRPRAPGRLLVSLLAALVGVAIAFRMMRLPDPAESAASKDLGLG